MSGPHFKTSDFGVLTTGGSLRQELFGELIAHVVGKVTAFKHYLRELEWKSQASTRYPSPFSEAAFLHLLALLYDDHSFKRDTISARVCTPARISSSLYAA